MFVLLPIIKTCKKKTMFLGYFGFIFFSIVSGRNENLVRGDLKVKVQSNFVMPLGKHLKKVGKWL